MLRAALRRCLCTTPQASVAAAAAAAVADAEARKFAQLSGRWWDRPGPLEALHSLNRLRVPLIRGAAELARGSGGLAGADVADLGCGGGLLAEPLARLGARVVGSDPVAESVARAAARPVESFRGAGGSVSYRCASVSELAAECPAAFDLAVASEVIEHVADWPDFVRSAGALLRPGGCLVLTTVNRTAAAYWLGVVAAERLLCLVPPGTHDWRQFVPPDSLRHRLAECGLETRLLTGMLLNPVTCRWAWTPDLSLSYGLVAQKVA